MKKAYLACALVVLTSAACKGNSDDGSGGAGGSGEATSTTSKTTATGMTTGSMSTTSGSMTTTGSMGSGSSSSGGPLMCSGPDPYTNIPTGECDLLQQDCTGNLTCVAVDDEMGGITTGCIVHAGLKLVGETCNQAPPGSPTSECEKGAFCIGPDNAPGVCTRVCCPGTGEPCGSGKCNLQINYDSTPNPPFMMVCTAAPACTLFTANACMPGLDCHPEEEGLATCQGPSGDNVPEGGACMAVNDCGDMQLCVGADQQNLFCRYACDFNTPGAAPGLGGCPAGQTCQGLQDFTNIGVCIPN